MKILLSTSAINDNISGKIIILINEFNIINVYEYSKEDKIHKISDLKIKQGNLLLISLYNNTRQFSNTFNNYEDIYLLYNSLSYIYPDHIALQFLETIIRDKNNNIVKKLIDSYI